MAFSRLLMIGATAAVVEITASALAPPAAPPVALQYFSGSTSTAEGQTYLELLDKAYRMISPADPEIMTPTGCYDRTNWGLAEGAQWVGNFWTQNSYGFGYSSTPFLDDALLNWLGTSYLWWFDHIGDGGQTLAGLADVPAGMLCDNGNPTGCNYMQCGPGRSSKLTGRYSNRSAVAARKDKPGPHTQSKRAETLERWRRIEDTAAVGHDWVIEGTLAGTLMQAELLLTTRNITGAKHFLQLFKQTSDFMETRRVQDSSPLTPGAEGLFFAGNGANLLAPAFGGQGLPAGCLVNASCGKPGFPECCTQRGFSYLTGLTVTYSAVLDRLSEVEALAFPAGRDCVIPNHDAPGNASCAALWQTRKAANDRSLPALYAVMESTQSRYLIRALSPDGERHGVYADRPPCPVDAPCPPQTRHGYFETSPNADAIALNVVNDTIASEIYASMRSIKGLSPCGFTLPNFPDYDDSCNGCDGGFGTWVSGGSWSTAEGRVILAHLRQRRYDLAAASMARILSPYAELFKLDNPIAHQGCGPGMYSQVGGRGTDGPILDVDVFGIPAAFLRGLLGYDYGATTLTLRPRLPPGITTVTQRFPARWGSARLFVTLQSGGGTGTEVARVTLNGTICSGCVGDGGLAATLSWAAVGAGATSVVVTIGSGPGAGSVVGLSGAESAAAWQRDSTARRTTDSTALAAANCSIDPAAVSWVANATAFTAKMSKVGLGGRFEVAQANAFLAALKTSTDRCMGRQNGSIGPIPAQPAAWSKYRVEYSQAKAEGYFKDAYQRVWTGLVGRIGSYERDNADPDEVAVLKLFRGASVEQANGAARECKLQTITAMIAAKRAELEALEKVRAEL